MASTSKTIKRILIGLGIILLGIGGILLYKSEPKLAALTPPEEIFPEHLRIKPPPVDIVIPNHILGQKVKLARIVDGKILDPEEVKYAYNSGIEVSGLPSNEVLKQAQKSKLSIITEDDSKRTKHSLTFRTNDSNTFIAEFISGEPQYYKDQNGEWWIADYATTTKDAFEKQTGKVLSLRSPFMNFMAETAFGADDTFYPDANSTDGRVHDDEVASVSWSTLVTGAGTYGDEIDPENILIYAAATTVTDEWNYLGRGIVGFDTDGTFPASISVSAASLSIWGYYKTLTLVGATPAINVYSSAPADETTIVAGDYDSLGTTAFSTSVASADFDNSDTAYTVFTLNAAGRAYIETSATSNINTNLGFRDETYDVPNSAPPWTSNGNFQFGIRYSETAGTANDPKLIVTWSAAAVAEETQIYIIE